MTNRILEHVALVAGLTLFAGCDTEVVAIDASVGADATLVDAGAADTAVADAATVADARVDGGPSLYDLFLAADDQQTIALCACEYALYGYDSAEACVMGETGPGVRRSCRLEAYAALEDTLAPVYECRNPLVETRSACYLAAMCDWDDQADCDDAYNAAVIDCARVGIEVWDQRDALVDACYVREVVGTGPESCSDTGVAPSLLGEGIFTGTTERAGDHRRGSCAVGDSVAADKTYRWIAPSAGTYVIDTEGSNFDTVLYVLSTCAGTELGCSDDGIGLQSRLELTLTEGQSIQIVVDGYGPLDAGTFVVNIRAAD